MATPKDIFTAAMSLEKDEKLTIPFASKSQQSSVRVALYRIKESFGEEGRDVTISQRENSLVLTKGKVKVNTDLEFSISKQSEIDYNDDDMIVSIEPIPGWKGKSPSTKKTKPGQAEVDALEKERLDLHEVMKKIVLAYPNERIAQEEINNPESEIFSLQTKLDLLVKRIKSLRDLYEIPVVRISATEEEYLRFEKEFQDEQEKERLAAEALADSLEC